MQRPPHLAVTRLPARQKRLGHAGEPV